MSERAMRFGDDIKIRIYHLSQQETDEVMKEFRANEPSIALRAYHNELVRGLDKGRDDYE